MADAEFERPDASADYGADYGVEVYAADSGVDGVPAAGRAVSRPDLDAIGKAEQARFATRFAGQLLVGGALLGAILTITLGVNHGPFSAEWWVFIIACAVGAAWGLVYILLPRAIPDPLLQLTPAAGAALITASMVLNHSNTADGMLLLTWPVLFAAYLLPRRTAYLTMLFVVACLTLVILEGHDPNRVALWFEVVSSAVLTLVIILQVRGQADRLKAALAEQARTDPLTGLDNRRAFNEALDREYARHKRGSGPLSLLAVDVDYFKRINDTWGHAAGDETLKKLGELLPKLVRSSDLVGRVGGEEFGIIMPDCGPRQAVLRADGLRAAVAGESKKWAHPLTVSIGVATIPDSASSVQELTTQADKALYQAKAAGRDAVKATPYD